MPSGGPSNPVGPGGGQLGQRVDIVTSPLGPSMSRPGSDVQSGRWHVASEADRPALRGQYGSAATADGVERMFARTPVATWLPAVPGSSAKCSGLCLEAPPRPRLWSRRRRLQAELRDR